jgi:thiamine biosynthesis protein ThiS
MKITLNGQEHTVQADARLGELLQTLDLQGKRIAVEVNREIVPRSEHEHFRLNESDTVEIVNAIGGG